MLSAGTTANGQALSMVRESRSDTWAPMSAGGLWRRCAPPHAHPAVPPWHALSSAAGSCRCGDEFGVCLILVCIVLRSVRAAAQ